MAFNDAVDEVISSCCQYGACVVWPHQDDLFAAAEHLFRIRFLRRTRGFDVFDGYRVYYFA